MKLLILPKRLNAFTKAFVAQDIAPEFFYVCSKYVQFGDYRPKKSHGIIIRVLEAVRRFQFGGWDIATNEITAIRSGSAKAEAV